MRILLQDRSNYTHVHQDHIRTFVLFIIFTKPSCFLLFYVLKGERYKKEQKYIFSPIFNRGR